jgi:hypothetical protein
LQLIKHGNAINYLGINSKETKSAIGFLKISYYYIVMQNKIIKSLCSKKNLFKLTTGALLSSISFATPFLMASCSFDLRASTIYGKIRGTRQDGIYSFKGIPYAKAPVGDLKFAPPHNPDH